MRGDRAGPCARRAQIRASSPGVTTLYSCKPHNRRSPKGFLLSSTARPSALHAGPRPFDRKTDDPTSSGFTMRAEYARRRSREFALETSGGIEASVDVAETSGMWSGAKISDIKCLHERDGDRLETAGRYRTSLDIVGTCTTHWRRSRRRT